MLRARLGGVELEYEVRGSGTPVVFIHAGLCADWFRALLDEPALHDGYHLIRYHRTGYAGSPRVNGPVSIAEHAEHCWLLLRHLGLDEAHVVGHSSSAAIALQLATDHPEAVLTVALLETALLAVPSGSYAAEALERYGAGDRAAAVDIWMRGIGGPGYRAVMEAVLPGAIERAVRDADTFFGQELPALRAWTFGPAQAALVRQPALVVLGGSSDQVSPVFGERHELLLAWLPRAEPFVLPGATHLLHVQNPTGMADRLARFATRHSRPAGGSTVAGR